MGAVTRAKKKKKKKKKIDTAGSTKKSVSVNL